MTTHRIVMVGALIVTVAWAGRAAAEDYVGWVAALEGRGEVLRAGGGNWAAAAPSDGVSVGDQVRTLADGRMKLLMRDDSVITLGENSQLVMDEQIAGDAPQSSFSLLMGKMRAIATDRYSDTGAKFEVTTPTAITAVRGTEFIAGYDEEEDSTLVVGIADTTSVRSRADAAGAHAVLLGPGQSTRVIRGRFPTAPTRVSEGQIRGLLNQTTATRDLSAVKGAEEGVKAEPRRPPSVGDRAKSPAERVVDQPVFDQKGRGVAPPPPPVPR